MIRLQAAEAEATFSSMVRRGAWFLGSVVLYALGMLTLVEPPTIPGWWLALLATEYGHWLAIAGLLMATVSVAWFFLGDRRTLIGASAGISIVAAGLLLRPLWLASKMRDPVALELALAFGSLDGKEIAGGELFQIARYLKSGPTMPRQETRVYSQGEDYSLELDLRWPTHSQSGAPAPVILLVHGGGWNSGSRKELPAVADWLASRGWAVASIDYRLAPRWTWPAPREDVRAAMNWLRGHATELGIDPDRLVLFGRSAGAQIALSAAYDATFPAVRGVISFYGPADMNFAYEFGEEDDVLKSLSLIRDYLGGPPDGRSEGYDDASPILHVRPEVPPTLLVHGRLDTLVWHRQSERLAARLSEVGATHYFLSLPWATHAFDFNLHGPGGQMALGVVARFLTAVDGG